MKEFDFDELDKAVHSLLGSKDDDQAKADESSAAPAANDDQTPPASTRNSDRPARRSGRFMDLVHPSSDTKRSPMPDRSSRVVQPLTNKEPAEEPVEEPPITPEPSTLDLPAEDEATEEPSIAKPAPSPEPLDEPKEVTEAATPKPTISAIDHSWPDPLEVSDSKTNEKTDNNEKTELAPEPKAEASSETAITTPNAEPKPENEIDEATSTPFIDAKVEKRPLGAFSETPDVPEAEENAKPEGEPLEQPQVHAPEVESPPEFAKDVLAAETKAYNVNDEKTDAKSEPTPTTSLQAATAGSIAQQYKELPEHSGDVVPRPIFDTKEYHPPLADPLHHGHAGWWIAIAGIILAATAAGFAYWFFIAAR